MACCVDYASLAGFIVFPPEEITEYGHSLACDYTIRVAEGKVTNILIILLYSLISVLRLSGSPSPSSDWRQAGPGAVGLTGWPSGTETPGRPR